MGVKGLWSLLEPTAKPIRLESLSNKILAIDASIWLHQFLKAMRDSSTGNVIQGAHLIGFFRRILKLLFYGIRPIFVFDGNTPELKRHTLQIRRDRKNRVQTDLAKTAQKLLSIEMAKSILVSNEQKKDSVK